MELTPKQQTIAFLWSFVLGALLVVVYIIAAVVKVLSPPTKIQLFVGDVLFMVFAAITNFLFAAAFTEGKVRLYTIFAELVSFVLIYLTVGRLLKKTVNILYRCILMFFLKLTKPVIRLGWKLTSSVKKNWGFMIKKVKKSKKQRLFPLHCRQKMLYNTNDKSVKR